MCVINHIQLADLFKSNYYLRTVFTPEILSSLPEFIICITKSIWKVIEHQVCFSLSPFNLKYFARAYVVTFGECETTCELHKIIQRNSSSILLWMTHEIILWLALINWMKPIHWCSLKSWRLSSEIAAVRIGTVLDVASALLNLR